MKKIFLPIAILLLLALAACGGDIDPEALVESASNAAEEVVDTVTEEISEITEESVGETAVSEGASVPEATIEIADGYYRLQTMFQEGENKCFEGNQYPDGGVLGGAAFMDDCQDVTGQMWKFVPADNGYYRMQTMFQESENKCFEGNQYPDGSVLNGAAFMDDCQNVTGQLWKVVESGTEGYFYLQTMFLEGDNKCLEGNQYPDGSVLGGAAFMDDCQNVTGQLWKFVPVGASGADLPSDRWAGIVVDVTMLSVSDVNISINGVATQSDGNGNFEVSVPRAVDRQYVINAEQAGYLPISQIHIGVAIEALTLEFQPVEQFAVDPTQPIAAEDSSGTRISIEANQLVDADGSPATEELTMNMYTYDLTSEEMVGDMSGTNSDGELVFMESAGAFYVSFEDDAGAEYSLAEGAEAEISIPVERENPDEVLTVWSYNEETGLWEEEGTATLEDDRYVATVDRFSYWNFDWEKREPACIKLDIEPSYLADSSPLQVRAILQTNPVVVRDLYITEQVNVLINLPANTDVQFFMPLGASTPFATTNSGAPWGGTGVPAFPFDVCNNGVTEIVPGPTTGSIEGQVTDAVTGDPIPGAQVCIQGTPQCVDSDANGNYTILDVAPGEQLLNVREDGYIPVNDQLVTVIAGESASRPIPMSAELAEGELRIVLTWGAAPSDLDSHLFLPDNTDIDYNVIGQTINGVKLDLDETNGNGPETITILEQANGSYTYAVYNFSGNGAATISTSGAVVKVYRGDQEIASYMAESLTGDGTWWYVFDLNGATGDITPVNTLSDSSPR